VDKRNRIGICRRSIWKPDFAGSEKIIRIYYRVSTDKQDFDMQLEAIQRMCKDKSVEYSTCKIYQDFGISGTTTNRPDYQKLLSEIEEGDSIFVYEFSRLWRDMSEQLRVTKMLKALNVIILSYADGKIDNNSDTLSVNIRGVLNEYEAERVRKRTRDGIAAKKARVAAGLDEWKPRGKDKTKRSNEGYLKRWAKHRGEINNVRN